MDADQKEPPVPCHLGVSNMETSFIKVRKPRMQGKGRDLL